MTDENIMDDKEINDEELVNMSEEDIEKLEDEEIDNLNHLMRKRLCFKDYMIYLNKMSRIHNLTFIRTLKKADSIYEKIIDRKKDDKVNLS